VVLVNSIFNARSRSGSDTTQKSKNMNSDQHKTCESEEGNPERTARLNRSFRGFWSGKGLEIMVQFSSSTVIRVHCSES